MHQIPQHISPKIKPHPNVNDVTKQQFTLLKKHTYIHMEEFLPPVLIYQTHKY